MTTFEPVPAAPSHPVGSPLGPAPPEVPANWYILATSAELGPGAVVSRALADREIVLFRAEGDKRVRAFAAHCAHMGCHLKHGRVVRDGLRCALHFRHIGPDGVFKTREGSESALRQRAYHVAEMYGVVFVYVGDRRSSRPPGLPSPRLAVDGEYLAKAAGDYKSATPWQALIANGCDIEHLLSVHGRVLKEDVSVSAPDALSYRIEYRTGVVGKTLSDRLMKWLSRNDVRASITVIGGTTILVESLAGGGPSFLMLSMVPQPDGGSMVRGAIGLASARRGPVDRLKLAVAQRLFKAFLRKDFGVFDGLRWHPPRDSAGPGDRLTQRLYDYFRTLPAATPPGDRWGAAE